MEEKFGEDSCTLKSVADDSIIVFLPARISTDQAIGDDYCTSKDVAATNGKSGLTST